MKYDLKVPINDNRIINNESVKDIPQALEAHSNLKVALEISSTKYLSSDLIKKLPQNILIRVSGGYDKERVERNKNKIYEGGESGIFYEEAVVYTRDELASIVNEIEQIEKGYQPNWSPLQKIIYTYDKLKREIMYDPKHEKKPSSETSSLRGIVTKETICSGYALIFKEIMDRNNIDCEYVEGYLKRNDKKGTHAWNIINLNGKKYGIDLTKDNAWFRNGNLHALDSFKQDISTFACEHIPFKEEKTQNYLETLSQFEPDIIDLIVNEIDKKREYKNTTYCGTRKDGSKFIITSIGHATLGNNIYFRYYYEDVLPNGKTNHPIILYSDNNLTSLIYGKLFGKEIPKGYKEAIVNVLFSKENIIDSIAKKTIYIGEISKINNNDEREFLTSYKEINKPDNLVKIFSIPPKIYERKDGTTFVAIENPNSLKVINGIPVYEYDIVETITKNNKRVVKRNTVYTEKQLFINNSLADEYLSRKRIDTTSEELGGYLGYLDEEGHIKYHEELLSYFKSKEINNENILHNNKKYNI